MWQCPKCGRKFKNQDQNHFCSEAPNAIDAYIEAQDKEVQTQKLRNGVMNQSVNLPNK